MKPPLEIVLGALEKLNASELEEVRKHCVILAMDADASPEALVCLDWLIECANEQGIRVSKYNKDTIRVGLQAAQSFAELMQKHGPKPLPDQRAILSAMVRRATADSETKVVSAKHLFTLMQNARAIAESMFPGYIDGGVFRLVAEMARSRRDNGSD